MSSEYVSIPVGEAGAGAPPPSGGPRPDGWEVRGFGIYVGVDETAAGVDVDALVGDVQRALTAVPGTRTFASVVLAPEGDPAAPLDLVRTALAEPSLARSAVRGVVVDLDRHQVLVDGRVVPLRYREQALLAHLVRHRGRVLDRPALQAALRAEGADEVSGRTIDVYLQRVRRRLEPYGEIVRTVRGRGYRIDPHPELHVREETSPVPGDAYDADAATSEVR